MPRFNVLIPAFPSKCCPTLYAFVDFPRPPLPRSATYPPNHFASGVPFDRMLMTFPAAFSRTSEGKNFDPFSSPYYPPSLPILYPRPPTHVERRAFISVLANVSFFQRAKALSSLSILLFAVQLLSTRKYEYAHKAHSDFLFSTELFPPSFRRRSSCALPAQMFLGLLARFRSLIPVCSGNPFGFGFPSLLQNPFSDL